MYCEWLALLSKPPIILEKPRVVLPSTSKKCTKCLPQVQRGYFSLFNQSTYCCVAFPLPLPSSLLKLHIIMLVWYQKQLEHSHTKIPIIPN